MLRVALVGLGDAGRHHARALAELNAEGALVWSAVCARSDASAFRADNAVPSSAQTFTTLEDTLAACDAVILATPDGLHADQVVAAANAGKHVLVEKPLALARTDGELAVTAARAKNVHLHVGYQLRHHAAHCKMHASLADIGQIREIDIRWAWPDPATNGWRARGQDARFWSLA